MSSLAGSIVGSLDIEEWQERDRLNPAPTFFARPAWALALQASSHNMRAAPLVVRLKSDRELIVPLMRISSHVPGWTHYVGMPLGTYTAILSEENQLEVGSAARAAIAVISAFSSSLTVNIWPFSNQMDLAGQSSEHHTSVIDLAGGLAQAVERMSGNARR